MAFPKVVKVRQDFPRPRVEDVEQTLREQFEKDVIASRIEPGMEIAITAGSRGIANIDEILHSLVKLLKEAGAEPFIVPAMGSHERSHGRRTGRGLGEPRCHGGVGGGGDPLFDGDYRAR